MATIYYSWHSVLFLCYVNKVDEGHLNWGTLHTRKCINTYNFFGDLVNLRCNLKYILLFMHRAMMTSQLSLIVLTINFVAVEHTSDTIRN